MKIKLKDGFTCEANEKMIKDWDFAKALAKCDSKNEMTVVEGASIVLNKLLGDKGEAELGQHLINEDGVIPTADIMATLKEILSQIGQESKKSQSSQE